MNLRKWVDLSGAVLLRNIGALREDLTNAADRIQTLERELSEAQRDAGRYRWLRHGDNDEVVIRHSADGDCCWLLRTDELDAAIDQARGA